MADGFGKAWSEGAAHLHLRRTDHQPSRIGGASLGKLSADVSEVSRVIAEQGLERLGISGRHKINLQTLPFHHHDPFDRMLIAQCEAEAMPLLPSDAKIARYGIAILDSTQ